ncbi:unnamed protein product [Leptidea sinapis]|uniref:Uncharacterized protein n=1 Tax=Leptidea sinapis TaxID=189913 RepID=A0A5E4QNK1_9NEOP|nr:unnamed protein product [Leptidea sinapis]
MATMDLTNEVVRLRAELEKVATERDMLLSEVSNLRRELELSELKHLQDDRDGTVRQAISKMRWKDDIHLGLGPYWTRVTNARVQWRLLGETCAKLNIVLRDIL